MVHNRADFWEKISGTGKILFGVFYFDLTEEDKKGRRGHGIGKMQGKGRRRYIENFIILKVVLDIVLNSRNLFYDTHPFIHDKSDLEHVGP